MIATHVTPSINIKYFTASGIAVLLSWILHEFAHWTTGELLGYDMAMTLNSAYPLSGQYANNSHSIIISAAGPLFTLTEAVLVFALMRHRKNILLFPFLFICFYMRLLATIISVANPNDEARISSSLELGKFTLPLVMTGILFAVLYKISKEYELNSKFILKTLGLVILFSSMIILADMFFKIRLI